MSFVWGGVQEHVGQGSATPAQRRSCSWSTAHGPETILIAVKEDGTQLPLPEASLAFVAVTGLLQTVPDGADSDGDRGSGGDWVPLIVYGFITSIDGPPLRF
ncbi:hypothetical protein [Kitasatospora sp. MMS16-BH015]|uniref:hypothetical protein n=1 Tax=Kitasatospora sp. MMS16-BH015 TaxID=2018025 RepID=UPI00143D63BD|nr:hypothetical protein [Kitasatospora sp. MMS16-BH015]